MATTLQAINTLLTAIGETPVTTVNTSHPRIAAVLHALNETSLTVQSKGYWFNTFLSVTLPVDGDGRVPVPADVLSVDPTDRWRHLVQREGFLYDVVAQTDVLNAGVACDLRVLFAYEDLPETAATYVRHLAAAYFAGNFDIDGVKMKVLQERVAEAQVPFKADHVRNSDVNMFYNGGSTAFNLYRIRGERYKPYM